MVFVKLYNSSQDELVPLSDPDVSIPMRFLFQEFPENMST